MLLNNVNRPQVVYLAGFGRSGSTLLERLLGEIEGWTHVGELVDLPRSVAVRHERCGCGLLFDDCPVWSAVGERAFGGWDTPEVRRLARRRLEVARQRQVPRLLALWSGATRDRSFGRRVREYQEGYGRIYRAVADVTGSRVVVDASKGPAHGLALAGADDYDLSMINLVRDPRAVAYSWSRRSVARPQATQSPERMWKISPARSAGQWAALQSEIELVRACTSLRSARLRYEDMIDHPVSAISTTMRGLGLPVGSDSLAHVEGSVARLGKSHGLSGNPGRFESGTVRLQLDSQWRDGLTRAEKMLVTTICLPLVATYGYPIRNGATIERTVA